MTDATWRAEKHPKFDVWRVVGDGMTISGLDEPTAHLIAAAREMQSALDGIVGQVNEMGRYEEPADYYAEIPWEYIDASGAALAKSRGET